MWVGKFDWTVSVCLCVAPGENGVIIILPKPCPDALLASGCSRAHSETHSEVTPAHTNNTLHRCIRARHLTHRRWSL